MKRQGIILILVIFSLFFLCIYIFTNRIPEKFIFGSEIMNFFYGIALSTIAASIFYFFQIFIPEKRRKKMIKKNFKSRYALFKEGCISIFLATLGGSYKSQLPKQLLNIKEFRIYFKNNFKDGQNRWDGVLNGLNDVTLGELIIEFEILFHEIDFFLNNISLYDEEAFDFFKRLKIAIYSLKNTSLDYDKEKILSGFLWELFAGWNFISGYRENDIFEEMLKKV